MKNTFIASVFGCLLIVSTAYAGDQPLVGSNSHQQASPPDDVLKSPNLEHQPSSIVAYVPAGVPINIKFADNGNSAEDSMAIEVNGKNIGGYNTFYALNSKQRKPNMVLESSTSIRAVTITHAYKTARYGLGKWPFNPGRIKRLEMDAHHIKIGASNIRLAGAAGYFLWPTRWLFDNDFTDVTVDLSWKGATTPPQHDPVQKPAPTQSLPSVGTFSFTNRTEMTLFVYGQVVPAGTTFDCRFASKRGRVEPGQSASFKIKSGEAGHFRFKMKDDGACDDHYLKFESTCVPSTTGSGANSTDIW